MSRDYEAGVQDGNRKAWWSRHSTLELARKAARKYARRSRRYQLAAYLGAHSGFVRHPDGRIEEVRAETH